MNHYYHVYCDGILGVKTNIRDFKWVYGSAAPDASPQAYEQCALGFEVDLRPEKALRGDCGRERFQSYFWDASSRTLSFRRTMLRNIRMGYDITVTDGKVVAEIGQHYYRLVQKRIMHLHGTHFLLSDLANVLLLRQGYLTLYASAVQDAHGKGIVCFAPPNTGKTVTATQLCTAHDCRLIGEDVVIAKDCTLYACPWTMSYRKKAVTADGGGAFGRVRHRPEFDRCGVCALEELIVLASGAERVVCDKTEALRRIMLLNGYLFDYHASPIIKVLGYFDPAYDRDWNSCEHQLLQQMAAHCACRMVYAPHPLRFGALVQDATGGCV